MIIWLLALLLLAVQAAAGYLMGGIRVACSLVGLIIAFFVTLPLARVANPVFAKLGMSDPFTLMLAGPLIVFVLIMIAFKLVGFSLHYKVDYFYEHKKAEPDRWAFERMNKRVGLCLGIGNAIVYFSIAMLAIYVLGYATTSMSFAHPAGGMVGLITTANEQLHASGFDAGLGSRDPMTPEYYEISDFMALIRQNQGNDQFRQRLANYPLFVAMAQSKEYSDLFKDPDLQKAVENGASVVELYRNPRIQGIVTNLDSARELGAKLMGELPDLKTYLETGKSPKYDPILILGRWAFDLEDTVAIEKKLRPTMNAIDLNKVAANISRAYNSTSLLATSDNKLRWHAPRDPSAQFAPDSIEGTWKQENSRYQISITLANKPQTFAAEVEGNQMNLTSGGFTMVFTRAD